MQQFCFVEWSVVTERGQGTCRGLCNRAGDSLAGCVQPGSGWFLSWWAEDDPRLGEPQEPGELADSVEEAVCIAPARAETARMPSRTGGQLGTQPALNSHHSFTNQVGKTNTRHKLV